MKARIMVVDFEGSEHDVGKLLHEMKSAFGEGSEAPRPRQTFRKRRLLSFTHPDHPGEHFNTKQIASKLGRPAGSIQASVHVARKSGRDHFTQRNGVKINFAYTDSPANRHLVGEMESKSDTRDAEPSA